MTTSFEDRISQLPDEILETILSLLNIVEASSTSVLSRRWQYLWTQVKVLHFYFPKMLRAIDKRYQYDSSVEMLVDKYVDWVNRVIRRHQGPHITDFKVVISLCGEDFCCDIDEWLSFAIHKSVQRLEINLCNHIYLGQRFGYSMFDVLKFDDIEYRPPYTFTNKVYSLIKSPFGLSCIKSLMQLSLTGVNVTGELVEHFLSNCPLLVGLRVCLSGHLVNLKIAGPSLRLKFLEISRCLGLRAVDIIHAPNLASLISHGFGRNQVVVRHAPSLVDLTVATEGFFDVLPASYFPQLESLTLSFQIPWNRAPRILPEFTSLKNLTFGGHAREGCSFLDWTFLIEKAPLLHTFTLQLMSPTRIRKEIEILPTELYLHRCLEVVKFVGNIDFELLGYFYERAVVLNTIIVDCRHPSLKPWQEFEENDRSMELRKLALDLKIQLAPKIKSRMTTSFEDRISQLPDEILVTILSFLNIVEASSTSVLSRRWQYLWTQVKVLHFYFPKMLRVIDKRPADDSRVKMLADKYVDWVNRVIRCHPAPHITDFKVIFSLSGKEFCSDVDKWLSFAIHKSVQRLEINLCGYTRLGERFGWMSDVYESLDVNCRLAYTPTINFHYLIKSPYGLSCIKSLMQLSLAGVNVTGGIVEHFLSNCPLLVGLRVSLSACLVNLKIAGPSLRLKFLEISRCLQLKTVDIIHAPNLTSLISHGFFGNIVVVRHAPSLVDLAVATQGFLNVLPASYFPRLESLTLSFDLRDRAPLIFPEFTSLKNLTFAGYACEEDSFLDWTFLIEKAPLLHTFTLQLMSPTRIRKQIEILPTERHLHICLEVVKFVGNIDFELLLYFLERAVAPSTIIVDCRHPSLEPWQEFEENERSKELRDHALVLKIQLAPKIKVVICS